jgi:hypothetical protein
MVRVAGLHHGGTDPVPVQPLLGIWRNRGTGTCFSAITFASFSDGMDTEPVIGRSYEAHSLAPPPG